MYNSDIYLSFILYLETKKPPNTDIFTFLAYKILQDFRTKLANRMQIWSIKDEELYCSTLGPELLYNICPCQPNTGPSVFNFRANLMLILSTERDERLTEPCPDRSRTLHLYSVADRHPSHKVTGLRELITSGIFHRVFFSLCHSHDTHFLVEKSYFCTCYLELSLITIALQLLFLYTLCYLLL